MPSPLHLRYFVSHCLILLITFAFSAAELFYLASSPAIQELLTHPPSNICPIAQDGLTFDTFPWTHNPTCVQAVLSDGVGSGQHQDFCVYTNSVFASGRGLSIITTPEIAASLTAESFAPFEEELDGPVLYEERETDGRGIGLFAKQDIGAGTTFILKHPILFVAREALSTPSKTRRHLLLTKAIEHLPEMTRKMFMNLVKSKGGPEVYDIIQTNSVRMKFEDGSRHLGVIPETARANHACRPNAYYRFDDYSLTLEAFTLKDIKAGEEINFSYGFSSLLREQRIEVLKANWGFTCTCLLCTANATTISASDARLTQISELQAALPTSPDSLPHLLGLLPNLIELLDEEDLIIEMGAYEEILAYAYSSFSVEKRARYWAERSKRHWEIVAGKDSFEAKRLSEFLGDVKGHGSWGAWKENPWEGVGKGHPWDAHEDDHDDDHSHDH